MDKKTIWNEKQNKPSLIVKDLMPFISEDIIYESLLRRGVFKWLSARRKIIKLKNNWKEKIKKSLIEQKKSQNANVNYWRGYRKALEECRAEVRSICHGERWEAPDFDKNAIRWLNEREKNFTH